MHACPLKCLSPAHLSSLLRAKRSGVKKENTFPFFLPFVFFKKKNRHDNDREYQNLEGECNLKAFKQVSHCDSSMASTLKSLATSANEIIKMTPQNLGTGQTWFTRFTLLPQISNCSRSNKSPTCCANVYFAFLFQARSPRTTLYFLFSIHLLLFSRK